ncbi:MAG TPA: sulfurtransferase [Bacteroidetes bacterium]|nr:sulfurtransferase [Bacteroidota bacterium]
MFNFLFGNKNLSSYLKSGAIVIDVRSGAEFDTGSALGAKNIPLNTLESRTEEIKASGKPVITCCRSGTRSEQARSILHDAGLDVINGGSWKAVERAINKL